MLTVKTRKQGNAVTVTVPKSLNVEPGKEYVVVKGESGAFTYVPKLEDIFEKAEKDNLDLRPDTDAWTDTEQIGRERI
jgi:antitoxin component of MazEF toxin-antitoxin module